MMTMQRGDFHDSVSTDRFSETTESPNQPDGSRTTTASVRHNDILSGRGKSYTKHPGNLRFDEIIKQNLQRYFSVNTHTDKKMITEEIVDEVTSLGRFLRYEKDLKQWVTMDREAARIKVAQALQYRQRRVSKSSESTDDLSVPNPFPPSGVHSYHGSSRLNFVPLPQSCSHPSSDTTIAATSGTKRASASQGSQLSEYRERKVSKSSESEHDTMELNPFAPAIVQSRGPRLSFASPPQSITSSLVHSGGNSAVAPSQSEKFPYRQTQEGADSSLEPIPFSNSAVQSHGLRPQPALSSATQSGDNRAPPHAAMSHRTFDMDDTSIGVAAAQMQIRHQRDQQTISRQIENLLGQRLGLQNLHNFPAAATSILTSQPNLSSEPSMQFASMDAFRRIGDNIHVQADHRRDNLAMLPSSLQQQQSNRTVGSIQRPLEPIRPTDSSLTEFPSLGAETSQQYPSLVTGAETSHQYLPLRSQNTIRHLPQEQPPQEQPPREQPQVHRMPGQQHQADDLDDYSLSNLLSDEEDTDPVSSWDDPAFDGDRR